MLTFERTGKKKSFRAELGPLRDEAGKVVDVIK